MSLEDFPGGGGGGEKLRIQLSSAELGNMVCFLDQIDMMPIKQDTEDSEFYKKKCRWCYFSLKILLIQRVRFDHLFGKTILSLNGKLEKNAYSIKFMFWLKWSEQSSPVPGKGVGWGQKHN